MGIIIKYLHCFGEHFSGSSPYISANAGDVQIQPLATTGPVNLSGVSQGAPPPPPGEVSGGSNPYRIGTGIGSRKPAYGASGIASFGSTSSSSGQPSQPSQPIFQPPPPPPQEEAFQVGMGSFWYWSVCFPQEGCCLIIVYSGRGYDDSLVQSTA